MTENLKTEQKEENVESILQDDFSKRKSRLVPIGVFLTVLYVSISAVVLWSRRCELVGLKLNELGDLMAGLLGPLAICWLILGFFQQRIELAQNTDALLLQFKELRNSVEQQRLLVQSTENSRLDENVRQVELRKPVFAVKIKGGIGSKNGMITDVIFTNHGAQIYAVEIKHSTNILSAGENFMNSHSRNWEADGVRTARFSLTDRNNGDLSICYQDSKGNSGVSVFDVIANVTKGTIKSIDERV